MFSAENRGRDSRGCTMTSLASKGVVVSSVDSEDSNKWRRLKYLVDTSRKGAKPIGKAQIQRLSLFRRFTATE